jgi:cell division protein FtsB
VKVDLGIWSKLTQVVIGLVAVAILLLIGMTYLPLIQQNENYRREIAQLDAEIQKQAEISRQLQSEIDAISNDPKTVERLAREKLRFAKPDETIVHFERALHSQDHAPILQPIPYPRGRSAGPVAPANPDPKPALQDW